MKLFTLSPRVVLASGRCEQLEVPGGVRGQGQPAGGVLQGGDQAGHPALQAVRDQS